MESVSLTGMVLTSMPIGEYDKRISFLSLERGKISVFLRGAKRPNSQLLAAGTPFSFGDFEIYEGKNSYSAGKVNIKNHFDKLKKDLTNVWYGYYFLEVAEYYARENADERERLALLYQSLRALESEKFSAKFVRLIYDLKTLYLTGEYPNIYSCMRCHNDKDIGYFSLEKRGGICNSCANHNEDIALSSSAMYTMQFIFSTPSSKLFSFRVSEKVLEELMRLYMMYRRRYFPHPFKSEEFLEL